MARTVSLSRQRFRSRSFDIDLTLEVERRVAADLYTVAGELTEQLTATFGHLTGEQLILTQLFCPVRDQRTVDGTGNRVLGYADTRCEHSRGKITVVALGRDDD